MDAETRLYSSEVDFLVLENTSTFQIFRATYFVKKLTSDSSKKELKTKSVNERDRRLFEIPDNIIM